LKKDKETDMNRKINFSRFVIWVLLTLSGVTFGQDETNYFGSGNESELKIRDRGVVYLDLKSSAYDFFERMTLKGIITFHDEVKPITRRDAARFLFEANSKKSELTLLEKEELDWLKLEFADELGNSKERWHGYAYSDSLFSFRSNPIAAYSVNKNYEISGFERWWGASVYAGYSDWFGINVNMRDRGEFGSNVDKQKRLSRKTGHTIYGAANGIEYSDVRGGINFSWKWGEISFQKDYFVWGHGKEGNLIHSNKAPSYPYLRFDLHPVDWLRFYYVHGFLNSNFIDSIGIYYRSDPFQSRNGEQFVKKNIVMNFLSITPFEWMDVSIGNSSVYKGDIKPEMMIPFLFFKYLDRDVGKGSIEDGNGQLHSDIVIRLPKTYKFYATFFLDVTELRNVMSNKWYNTWFGFTFGGKKIDLVVPNLDVSVEYTRVSPWVYEHRDSAMSYKHIDYVLGHWIGQNADLFTVRADYSFLRGLKISAYAEMLRKGGLKSIKVAYGSKEYQPFLYGPVRKDFRGGIEFRYEVIHDAIINGYYEYSNISDEDAKRTPAWQLGKKHSFGLGLSYGM